jgi:hypothetical protein
MPGWGYSKQAIVPGANQLPASLMDHPVVPVAQENQVRQISWAALGPMQKVVRCALRCGALTPGPLAELITRVQSAAGGTGDNSPRPPHIDNNRIAPENDPGH